MIEGLKPYPSYKDSGVPWLGQVPEHWDVRRLKYLLRETDLRSTEGKEQLLRVSQYTGVTERRSNGDDDAPDTRAASLAGYKLAKKDDLAINIMLAWNGSLGVSRFSGIVSPAYCVYRFRSPHQPWFFHELLRSPLYKGRIKTASRGVVESRLRLYTDDLYRIEALCPPPAEQEAIVRFVQHAERRIGRYIRAKQKLIKLLEEQKQAIIHRAVTRGLDPNVRLKPSGVEWLGDIPERWRVVPLKWISRRIQNGATPPSQDEAFYSNDVGLPWYGPSSIRNEISVGTPVRRLTDAAFRSGRARLVHGPAILIVVVGATAGRIGLMQGDGATNQQITSYEVREELADPSFLVQQLRGATESLRSTASTATIPMISSNTANRCAVALPSVEEQSQIVSGLAACTTEQDKAISAANHEITLLREYRIRLIADVVTGKLDVREAAARLPDEVEEPPEEIAEEALDEEPGEDFAETEEEAA